MEQRCIKYEDALGMESVHALHLFEFIQVQLIIQDGDQQQQQRDGTPKRYFQREKKGLGMRKERQIKSHDVFRTHCH